MPTSTRLAKASGAALAAYLAAQDFWSYSCCNEDFWPIIQVSDRSKLAGSASTVQSGSAGLEARMAALEGQMAEMIRLQKRQPVPS